MSKFKYTPMTDRKKDRSLLDNIDKTNKFIVPEGYFENFTSGLHKGIIGNEPSVLPKHKMYRLAVAASFIGFLVIVFAGLTYILIDKKSYSNSDIAEVVDFQIGDFDEVELYEALSEAVTVSPEDNNEESTIEAMINYLTYSDFDVSTLADEF